MLGHSTNGNMNNNNNNNVKKQQRSEKQMNKKLTASEQHYKEIFKTPNPLALTSKQQDAAIRQAFYNEDTLPQDNFHKNARGKFAKLMNPQTNAMNHPATDLLQHYADNGCPVDCGKDWSREHIETLLQKGPHKSSTSQEAVDAFNTELKEKIRNGYSKVVRYGDIKKNLPKKLKISPVAMIPHKSRSFRTILDLSFQLRLKGIIQDSVNSATKRMAPAESMVQLGQCMQRIVALLADNYDPKNPFVFSKLDIKDGFWRMSVNEDDAWNFCYVLPTVESPTNIDDILIVVPSCLQMGWCESPPFFCAASETARDVITTLLQELTLPKHDTEDQMMRDANIRLHAAAAFCNITEVFVDDFIAATNNATEQHLRHFSRAMLLGVHAIFPPPATTGHSGEDPISQKKLAQGEGTWSYTKEILGWLVDGANFTIQLPPTKCDTIVANIKHTIRRQTISLQQFQELAGKLQHASYGIPGGKGLFSPIYKALQTTKSTIRLTPYLKSTLRDWRTFVQQLATIPTPVQLLVPENPNYIQYTDSCKLGAGGVITPGIDNCPYVVWKYEWPKDIQQQLVSSSNKEGKLTINDLELAGLVLGWLVMEQVFDSLRFKHVGMFCDNTSAVAWCYKGNASKSMVSSRLLRLLYARQRQRQASTLLPINIAGKDNTMADTASRAFKNGDYFHISTNLLTYFNNTFPLQTGSWQEYSLHPGYASRVISCLRGEQLQMESLLKLPKLNKNIGNRGAPTALNVESNHSSNRYQKSNMQSSLQASPPESGPALTATEIKSVFKQSRMRLRPSQRPSTWLANKVPSMKHREHTFFPSKDVSKASDEKIHQQSPN